MQIRRTEVICCIYHTEVEREGDISKYLGEGYRLRNKGAASFDVESLKDAKGFEPGELYLFAEYEK